MTDTSRMLKGIHKGTRMLAVPAMYLLHLPEDVISPKLKKYVADNISILKLEARRDGRLQYKNSKMKR
jgi:hypothetical protein